MAVKVTPATETEDDSEAIMEVLGSRLVARGFYALAAEIAGSLQLDIGGYFDPLNPTIRGFLDYPYGEMFEVSFQAILDDKDMLDKADRQLLANMRDLIVAKLEAPTAGEPS